LEEEMKKVLVLSAAIMFAAPSLGMNNSVIMGNSNNDASINANILRNVTTTEINNADLSVMLTNDANSDASITLARDANQNANVNDRSALANILYGAYHIGIGTLQTAAGAVAFVLPAGVIFLPYFSGYFYMPANLVAAKVLGYGSVRSYLFASTVTSAIADTQSVVTVSTSTNLLFVIFKPAAKIIKNGCSNLAKGAVEIGKVAVDAGKKAGKGLWNLAKKAVGKAADLLAKNNNYASVN
jgi:hypothetical protein